MRQHEGGEVDGVVEDGHHARAERGAGGAGRLEREFEVELLRPDEHAGGATEQDRTDGAGRPACEIDEVAQRHAERHFVEAGHCDVARQAEQPMPVRAGRPERPVVVGPGLEDVEHVEQGLGVVDRRRLAEQTVRRRERRLVPRFAAKSLDRLHRARFPRRRCRRRPRVAARCRTARPDPRTSSPSRPAVRPVRSRSRAASWPGGTRHGCRSNRARRRSRCPAIVSDSINAERVVLHHDPVLERARLGFVGVGDDVFRSTVLVGDGTPLDRRRERGTAAARQLGRPDLVDDRIGADLDRVAEHRVSAVVPIRLQRRRVDDADPVQQSQVGGPVLRQPVRGRLHDEWRVGRHVVGTAPSLDEPGGRPLALAEARPTVDLLAVGFERSCQRLGSGDVTRRVHAHVVDRLRRGPGRSCGTARRRWPHRRPRPVAPGGLSHR